MDIGHELTALRKMNVKQLRHKYYEVYGDTTNTGNKVWLVKRIAYRLQVLASGDLTERALQRAGELANDADLRLNPPTAKPFTTTTDLVVEAPLTSKPRVADDRLPPPGTLLTRAYKGTTVQVHVLAHGFEYEGIVYPSLSAVAKKITGSHCNGFLFFCLGQHGAKA